MNGFQQEGFGPMDMTVTHLGMVRAQGDNCFRLAMGIQRVNTSVTP